MPAQDNKIFGQLETKNKNEILTQVFCYGFCEIFKNIRFTEYLLLIFCSRGDNSTVVTCNFKI